MFIFCVLLYWWVAGIFCLTFAETSERLRYGRARLEKAEIAVFLIFGGVMAPVLLLYLVIFRWIIHYSVRISYYISDRIEKFQDKREF
jgi:hypothetical protein